VAAQHTQSPCARGPHTYPITRFFLPTPIVKVCMAKCMDRYLDAMAIVSQTWAMRARSQQDSGMGGTGLQ